MRCDRCSFLVLAACHVVSASQRFRRAPDLWAETAVDPALTQELQLTRTAGDAWYTVPLRIGGNTSRVIVDTASPWLWSYSGNDKTTDDGEEPEKFSISYLSADLGGNVVSETVALHADGSPGKGRCKAGKATHGDTFWLKQYKKTGVQGVLGLACGTADSGAGAEAAKGLQTGLACASSALDNAGGGGGSSKFTLRLTPEGGTLSFGATPMDLLRGLVRMPPAMRCGNWRAPLRVRLGSKDFGFADATLDSAAPGIIGLSERVASLAEGLGAQIDVREGKMVFVMPCSRASQLPAVELRLGDRREAVVLLSGDQLLVPDDDAPKDKQGKQCRLIFMGWDSPQWLLGMPFFHAVRGVVFDPSSQSVSIAPF